MMSVLQVPEACDWNPYVHAAEQALRSRKVTVLRPGICVDGRDRRAPAGPPTVVGEAPTIVHLHWPEKLARQVSAATATRLLADLVAGGSAVVQTVHNVRPHEPSRDLVRFLDFVDGITDGVHAFSRDHEAAARRVRPGLPDRVLHLPHPRFPMRPTVRPDPAPEPPPGSVGCFGRLRGYKGIARFAGTYLRIAGQYSRLVVAGHPDDMATHRQLTDLAAAHPGLVYRPGFVACDDEFWALLASVEWVALPYQRLYSSGVLVAALQLGRRILSPCPTGGCGRYGTGFDRRRWLMVDPWDDERAAEAVLAADPAPAVGGVELALPTWEPAADALVAFYAELIDNRIAASAATRQRRPYGRE
jgi:glycosyltransferase involved in cell wall biosynthesis